MSECETLTFGKVTQEVWRRCVDTAAQYGVAITTDTGQITHEGFTLAWAYDRPGQNLSLQCIDSPWWAPCSLINGKICDLAEGWTTGRQPEPQVTTTI
jgi:hypothetical protein